MKANYFYTAIVSFVFLGYSCNKQLNVLPTTTLVDGVVIVDQKSADAALNGVYFRFANAVSTGGANASNWYLNQQDLPSSFANTLRDVTGPLDIEMHIYRPEDAYISPMWDWSYRIVNAANGFIKNLEASDIAAIEKKRMIAEARFLRAFAFSTVLFNYGEYWKADSEFGIIIHTEFIDTEEAIRKPRSTVAESYVQIIADLDAAIPDLKESRSEKYYATRAAAQLLKARVLMNRRTVGDLETVVDLTTAMINSGDYQLEEHLSDIFLDKTFTSDEVILGIQPLSGQVSGFSRYMISRQYVVTSRYEEFLSPGDARRNWVYKPAIDPYSGEVQVFCKYYGGSVLTPSADPKSECSYAFRLTEAYLLKAEALARLGTSTSDARELLKEVKEKSDVTDFTDIDNANSDELIGLIIKEYVANYIGEAGIDWLALRRLPFAKLQEILPTIQSPTQLYLPIPRKEIESNNSIKQSPGY